MQIPSKKNLKKFNTLQHLLREQQNALLGYVCLKNLVFNLLVIEGGTINEFFHKILKDLAPSHLQSYLLPDNERTYNTR